METAVIKLDDGARILDMNTAAEQCLMAGRHRALGRDVSAVTSLPDELLEAIRQPLEYGSSRRLHDVQIGGGTFDCTVLPLENREILLELHNLEWAKKRSRLRQLEVQTGMLELLSRNLGHEIRNPLGGIRGAAQMLASEVETPELETLARLVMREADRIDELILRFGQPQLEVKPFQIYPLLDEVLDLVQAEFGTATAIERDYDPSIPGLQGDASAVRQVILNLVRNALQAGATTLLLRTRIGHGDNLPEGSPGATLRLDVIDDGGGVPSALRSLLFLPLVTGRRDGTGLGLALSQQIAAAHGGLLAYEPLNDSGSRFTLFLPLNRGPETREESVIG